MATPRHKPEEIVTKLRPAYRNLLAATFVTSVHFVTATPTPGDAMQQKFAVAGSTSRMDAHVFGSVVSHDGPDLLIGWPVDVRRIPVLHDDPPFIDRPRYFCRRTAFVHGGTEPGSSIDEGTGISGILQDRRHRRNRRARPAQFSMPVAARQSQATIVQHAHDLGDGTELQECLEDKLERWLGLSEQFPGDR